MRLILKREKKRPKAPKTATLTSIARYQEKLKEVDRYNKEVRAYNSLLCREAEAVQRAVAGFGKGKKIKSVKRGRK